MSKFILGIDPGLSGALALIETVGNRSERGQLVELVEVWDMPVVDKVVGKGKEVSATLLAELVEEALAYVYGNAKEKSSLMAVLEVVRAMPGQGSVSMFGFGRSVGTVEGVLAGKGLRVAMVRPQVWKKEFGLIKKEKDAARGLVVQRFPRMAKEFKRKKDCDRADAVLMALWGSKW